MIRLRTRQAHDLRRLSHGTALVALVLTAATAGAQQRSEDSFTRYELLEPDSAKFRIVYDVTATTAGATHYLNPIRPGSEPTVHAVTDRATGKPLKWTLVDGRRAARTLGDVDPEARFIEVRLTRPVPDGGEARIRIDKTYEDAASYRVEGEGADRRLVFERSLGIPRNAVVLPAGWELVRCTVPSQVALEDGRVRISFLHRGPGAADLRLEARPLPGAAGDARPTEGSDARKAAPEPSAFVVDRPAVATEQRASARIDSRHDIRAAQDREIVYFLQQPETHAFRLYHDTTETRPGVDRYLNVVRPGSRATDPSATMLDTGRELEVETLKGGAITERGLDIGEEVTADTEVVVIWFDAPGEGESRRFRIWETYTDPGRYGLHPASPDGSELLWDRSFGRNRNTVVLPEGWWLTHSTIPAVIDLDDEGRVRLLFENDRPDAIDVLLRARRRG